MRHEDDRLVLEVPAQTRARVLVWLIPWQLGWLVGALLLPVYLRDWIDNTLLWLLLSVLGAGLWMVPWVNHLLMIDYWLRGMETITIRPGTVEIERGVGRRVRRLTYEGIESSSWRVSPWRHHLHDWHHPPGWYDLYGSRKIGGALTFTHGRRAVRCGRNLGTRQARVVLREVCEFLGEPTEGKPPKRRPKWLIVADGGTTDC